MKVLLTNGSPHEKGCTYTALSLIAGELNAAGIETEILNVGTKPVGGCIGCGGCAAGKGCVFGGVVNEAIEKAKTSDAFVFGTPVHYASASGNMTSFMDRLAYAGGRYLAYKPAAVCCSARRAGTTSTLAPTGPWSTARTPSRCCRTPRAAPSCRSWAATWPGFSGASRPAKPQASSTRRIPADP